MIGSELRTLQLLGGGDRLGLLLIVRPLLGGGARRSSGPLDTLRLGLLV